MHISRFLPLLLGWLALTFPIHAQTPTAESVTVNQGTKVLTKPTNLFRANRAAVIADGIGTAAERGQTKVVHIAVRTDGRDGIGTAEDPRDGSTATKLDAIFPAGTSHTVWVLGEGTFDTRGVAVDYNGTATLSSGVVLKSGATLRGQGQSRTTLRLLAGTLPSGTYNTTTTKQRRDLIMSDASGAGNHVSNLTVDINRDNQSAYAALSANVLTYAVNLNGLDSSVRDVTVRGVFNTSASDELFPVILGSSAGTWVRPATGYIERVTFEQAHGYMTALNLVAGGDRFVQNSLKFNAATNDVITTVSAHGYLDGETVYFDTLTGGAGLAEQTRYFVRDKTSTTFKVALTPGGTAVDITTAYTGSTCGVYRQHWITGAVRDCIVYGLTSGASYSDTQAVGCGGWKDVIVEGNKMIGLFAGVFLDTWAYSHAIIRNNHIQIRSNPAGQAGFAVFAGGGGYLWEDFLIEGNVVTLSYNTEAFRLNGATKGFNIRGNTVKWDKGPTAFFAPSFANVNETFKPNLNLRIEGNRLESSTIVTTGVPAFGAALTWASGNRYFDGTATPIGEKFAITGRETQLWDAANGVEAIIAGDQLVTFGEAISDIKLPSALGSGVLTTNATGYVLSVPLAAGQSIRRNAGNTAFEAYTAAVLSGANTFNGTGVTNKWEMAGSAILSLKGTGGSGRQIGFFGVTEVSQPSGDLSAGVVSLGLLGSVDRVSLPLKASDPAAPATGGILYTKDVAGKAALFIRFPTGAVQQIAIEP